MIIICITHITLSESSVTEFEVDVLKLVVALLKQHGTPEAVSTV